ncbi:unnamed protein product, partial [Medioppia subpectinata]
MGWADVGYHSDHILSPNIDTLAADGVVLNQFYTHSVGVQSRTALFTAVHPIHTGYHGPELAQCSPTGLPLHHKLWPQYMKQYDYSTHIVGKWQLGFARKDYTPTHRGFDSHVGFWSYFKHYYQHTGCESPRAFNTSHPICGHDFRHNMTSTTEGTGVYATHLYRDRYNHDQSRPLFLVLSHQALHAYNLIQPDPGYIPYMDRFAYIANKRRQTLAAMAYALDESIGAVVQRLQTRQMLNNSIVVFVSDGGPNISLRVPAFIWSPLLAKSGYISDALFDVADVLPTVLEAVIDSHHN